MPLEKSCAVVGRRVSGGKAAHEGIEILPGLEPGQGFPCGMSVSAKQDAGEVHAARGFPPFDLMGEKALPLGFQHKRQRPVEVEMHEKAKADDVFHGREDMPFGVIPETAGAVFFKRAHRRAVREGEGFFVVAAQHIVRDRLFPALRPPGVSLPVRDGGVGLEGPDDCVQIVAKFSIEGHVLSPFSLVEKSGGETAGRVADP